MRKLIVLGVAAALALGTIGMTGCGSTQQTGTTSGSGSTAFAGTALVGAGATFPQPVYALWTKEFVGVEGQAQINYQAIGSGGGIQQFTAKTVDFGATDVPLKDTEAAAIKGSYIEFPTMLGAVVVAYNVPGVTGALKLDGPTVAGIFLGTIKKWNDPAIAAQNSGVTLPDMAIQVVHRADGSGTTGIFTGWLKMESPVWSTKVGSGKSVQWPVGQGGNGNAGVAAAMSQTKGSIGYLEYQYASTTGLGVADIKAPDGTYVTPSVQSVTLAGGGLTFPITSSTNILDSKTAGAYPISSATYILIYTDQTDKVKAQTLTDFWTWALTKGQSELSKLSYAPLPDTIDKASLGELAKITVGGAALTPSASVK
jgi:phosphate transport system substrate-binding protein